MRALAVAVLALAAAPLTGAGAHPTGSYAALDPAAGTSVPVGESVRFHLDPGEDATGERIEIAREEIYDADGTLAASEDLALVDGVADKRFTDPGRYVFLAVWRTALGERQSETRTLEITPRLTRRRAESTVRVTIAERAQRRPRSLDLRCRRVDASTFRCLPSWLDRRFSYAGTLRVRREVGRVRYRFRGVRARHTCTRRYTSAQEAVDECSRRVRWRG